MPRLKGYLQLLGILGLLAVVDLMLPLPAGWTILDVLLGVFMLLIIGLALSEAR